MGALTQQVIGVALSPLFRQHANVVDRPLLQAIFRTIWEDDRQYKANQFNIGVISQLPPSQFVAKVRICLGSKVLGRFDSNLFGPFMMITSVR